MRDEAGEFLSLEAAASKADVSVWTIRKRLRAIDAPLYVDPTDHRFRLVRKEDLERAFRPIPCAARNARTLQVA